MINLLIQASYFAAAFLFIFGLKRMSSPVTARGGIVWAGAGMVVAVLVSLAFADTHNPQFKTNLALILIALAIGNAWAWWQGKRVPMTAMLFGVLMTVPIGGADMPVVISLYNAFTGMAVGLEGFVLQNPAMIIAGVLVGSAGTLLTILMARAMNRSIPNILFSNFGET